MRAIKWSLFIFSLIGFFDSLYLTWGALTGNPLSCGILEGCNTVAQSPYSWVFGVVPLAMLGVVYYIGMLGLSTSLLWAPFSNARTFTALWSAIGVLFSAYFLYLQAYVINAFCIYCLLSAALIVLLFALSVFLPRRGGIAT